ncbi:unnamed protein product [Microthlaspi erraticum]|uniref:Uncharacterized protein n=1 Tax=Microthlaspi erraticum TaxID=1685480 RepID=A0A6D2J0E3_9BRAS|nr:unnamed protein product [Microthlaspi erraticum]
MSEMDGVARGCGARGRGAEAVEAGAEIVDFGGFGRECGAECGDCVGDPVVIGSFSASGSTRGSGSTSSGRGAAEGCGICSAAGCGFDGAVLFGYVGHMQRIGMPYFEGGVSPEAADEWRQRLERNFQSIRFLV